MSTSEHPLVLDLGSVVGPQGPPGVAAAGVTVTKSGDALSVAIANSDGTSASGSCHLGLAAEEATGVTIDATTTHTGTSANLWVVGDLACLVMFIVRGSNTWGSEVHVADLPAGCHPKTNWRGALGYTYAATPAGGAAAEYFSIDADTGKVYINCAADTALLAVTYPRRRS